MDSNPYTCDEGPDRHRVPAPEDARRTTLLTLRVDYGACAGRAEFGRTPEEVPAGAERKRLVRAQRAICRRCPVWDFCRELGLRDQPRVGILGGLTAGQRRQHLRQDGARITAARDADREREARMDARDSLIRAGRAALVRALDRSAAPSPTPIALASDSTPVSHSTSGDEMGAVA